MWRNMFLISNNDNMKVKKNRFILDEEMIKESLENKNTTGIIYFLRIIIIYHNGLLNMSMNIQTLS